MIDPIPGLLRASSLPLIEMCLDRPANPAAMAAVVAGDTRLTVVHRAGPDRLVLVDPAAAADAAPATHRATLVAERSPRPLPDPVLTAALAALAPPDPVTTTVETGLKAVDLFTPIPRHGTVAMLGGHGAGRMAFRMELAARLRSVPDAHVTLCVLATGEDAPGVSDMLRDDPRLPADVDGPLHTFWFVSDRARRPSGVELCGDMSVALYFSPLLAAREHFPAVDPIRSAGAALRTEIVGADHVALARRAREVLAHARTVLADPAFAEYVALDAWDDALRRDADVVAAALARLRGDDRLAVLRARRIEAYLTQLFTSLAAVTGHPGEHVPLATTLADVAAILDGAADDLPESALRWIGALDEAWGPRVDAERRLW